MKLVLHQVSGVKGNIRMPYLAPEAALALLALEKDTDGLVYTDMWRDPMASLLARRSRRFTQLPGYSTHNYGLAIDLDVKAILQQKKIRYEDLLRIMKKRGWYCHRKDGLENWPEADHFDYLGANAQTYLERATFDPASWDLPGEMKIWELYGKNFQLSVREVQEHLAKMHLFSGAFTGHSDPYTREAILAFQRAWDLTQTGMADISTCRVLIFVSAEIDLGQIPAWAVSGA